MSGRSRRGCQRAAAAAVTVLSAMAITGESKAYDFTTRECTYYRYAEETPSACYTLLNGYYYPRLCENYGRGTGAAGSCWAQTSAGLIPECGRTVTVKKSCPGPKDYVYVDRSGYHPVTCSIESCTPIHSTPAGPCGATGVPDPAANGDLDYDLQGWGGVAYSHPDWCNASYNGSAAGDFGMGAPWRTDDSRWGYHDQCNPAMPYGQTLAAIYLIRRAASSNIPHLAKGYRHASRIDTLVPACAPPASEAYTYALGGGIVGTLGDLFGYSETQLHIPNWAFTHVVNRASILVHEAVHWGGASHDAGTSCPRGGSCDRFWSTDASYVDVDLGFLASFKTGTVNTNEALWVWSLSTEPTISTPLRRVAAARAQMLIDESFQSSPGFVVAMP